MMLRNGQTYFKDFKYLWPFFNVIYDRLIKLTCKSVDKDFIFRFLKLNLQISLPISNRLKQISKLVFPLIISGGTEVN